MHFPHQMPAHKAYQSMSGYTNSAAIDKYKDINGQGYWS